ncbi:Integrin [Balamuthia mandrillaris]
MERVHTLSSAFLVLLAFLLLLLPCLAAQAQPFIQQEALLKPSRLDLDSSLGFGGYGLSLRDGLLAVGSPSDSSSFSGIVHNGEDYPPPDDYVNVAGAVWLFRRGALGTWKQEAFLKSHVVEEWGMFGHAVKAANPNMVLVGNPGLNAPVEQAQLWPIGNTNDSTTMFSAGAVGVFVRDVDKQEWRLEALLGPPIARAMSATGSALASLDEGRTVFVQVSDNTDMEGVQTLEEYLELYDESLFELVDFAYGAVLVFQREEAEGGVHWSIEAVLKPYFPGAGYEFGNALAADGDTIIVGAPKEDSDGRAEPIHGKPEAAPNTDGFFYQCGAAYVFVRSLNETSGKVEWQQQAMLKPPVCTSQFGATVALHGDIAVVGNFEDLGAEEAYVFVRNATTQQWKREERLSMDETCGGAPVNFARNKIVVEEDLFFAGASAFKSDVLAPGVHFEDLNCTAGLSIGAALAFQRTNAETSSTAEWQRMATFRASNPSWTVQAAFGQVVDFHKGIFVVGAPKDQSNQPGITYGAPAEPGGSPIIGGVFVFASDLHGECEEDLLLMEFLAGKGGDGEGGEAKCVGERWFIGGDVVVEGEEVWRREGERGVGVKGGLVVSEGGKLEVVVESVAREEVFLSLDGCSVLRGTVEIEVGSNVEISNETAIPVILEKEWSSSECSFESARVEVVFSDSLSKRQNSSADPSWEVSLRRNGNLLEAVFAFSSDSSSSSSSSSLRNEDEDSDDNNVVVAVVVSVVVFLLLLIILAAAFFFIIRKQKRRKTQKIQFGDKDNLTEMEEAKYLHRNGDDEEDGEDEEEDEELADSSVPKIRKEEVEYCKDPVASGAFGVVYKGKWKGKECAVKVCSAIIVDAEMRQEFIKEAEMMHQLGGKKHHCTTLFGVMRKGKRMCLITEWAEHGSAYDLLINPKTKRVDVPWLAVVKIARDAARGLRYLHSLNVVHRDIAARNILVCQNYKAVVGDFGMSRVLEKMYQTTKSNVGAIKWMAPEAFKNYEYSKETDSFSFGVFLWELCTRQKPWDDKDANYVAHKVLYEDERLPIRENEDEVMKELLERCWQTDPKQRYVLSYCPLSLYSYFALYCTLTYVHTLISGTRPSMEEICNILESYYQTLKNEALECQQKNQVAGYMQAS